MLIYQSNKLAEYHPIMAKGEKQGARFPENKKMKRISEKQLTNKKLHGNILSVAGTAGVAQLVEQLICNQQVGGSNPSTSSKKVHMGEFQSGQMGQTVNLLSLTSVVRIHLPPPEKDEFQAKLVFFLPILAAERGRLCRKQERGICGVLRDGS